MGFESFRVELRGGDTKIREANAILKSLPNIKADDQFFVPGSACYLHDDGNHVLELELMDSPVRLSCRFTLCHPLSVDVALLGLARELMAKLGMNARICDDVDSRSFSLAEFGDFAATVSRYISSRRAEWVAAFGDKPLAATTNEVHQQIILPRCRNEAKQAT